MARLPDAPAVRRALLEVQRAQAIYGLARANGVPNVTVGVGARRAQDLGRNQPVFSVSVPLPFFDRNQGTQLEALRRRDAAQATAQAEELRLRSEVLQMADLLQARKEEVEALRREVLPGAQSAYEAAKTGFELGKFSFLDALDAQRTWLQVAASTSRRWRRSTARPLRSTASSAHHRRPPLTGNPTSRSTMKFNQSATESVRASLGKKQMIAIAVVLALGAVGTVSILRMGGSSPTAEEKGDAHGEAKGHGDDEHHGEAKSEKGHKDADSHAMASITRRRRRAPTAATASASRRAFPLRCCLPRKAERHASRFG